MLPVEEVEHASANKSHLFNACFCHQHDVTNATGITSVTVKPTSDSIRNGPASADRSELVSGQALWTALGYRTAAQFRQAACRSTVPVHVFDIPGRRGKHAFRQELEAWLDELRKAQKLEAPTDSTGSQLSSSTEDAMPCADLNRTKGSK